MVVEYKYSERLAKYCQTIQCECGRKKKIKYKPSPNSRTVRTKTIVTLFMCQDFFCLICFGSDRISDINITQNMQINLMQLSLYN